MTHVLNELYRTTGFAAAAEGLRDLFGRALADESISAWVCINDDLALHFLQRRRIAVPGRLSLAGFDNTLLSCALGLTSFDMGYAAAGNAAVRSILTPNSVRHDSDGVVRIKGRLVVRGTTGVRRSG